MTSMIAKYVSKKILGESIANNFGQEDAYFETVPATRLDGRPTGKTKKRRKALPAGISDHDAKVLTKVKRRAYRLDMSLFSCCGIRFGWSSVIGLFPMFGDALDAFMAMMVLRTCEQIEGGLPNEVRAKMMFNIILDFGIGITPIIGDLFDAVFKANTRNAVVLEKHLRTKGAQALKAQGQRVPTDDPTDPHVFDTQLQEELGPPPEYTPPHTGTYSQQHGGSPQKAQGRETKKGGWFSGFGSKKTQPDPERGQREAGVLRDENAPPPQPLRANEPRLPNSTLQKNRY